jgi:pyruvate/2-oxoglutarate dehydrogenase complex dihydrolipoamide dehydrogenase (E3) component
VASARAAFVARRGEDFGVMIDGPIHIDMKKVKARKDAIVNKSTQGIEKWLKNMKNTTVFEGHGRFEGPNTVRVDDHLLEADKIFINVGARPFIPSLDGIETADFLTSSDMVELSYVPEHLIIVGGSYTGLEFGQIFRRFGAKVTIVEKSPRLISRDDEDVSEAVREILENEGVDIRLESECISVAQRGENVRVGMDCDTDDREVEGSHLLLATGRRPNTEDLGVEEAGIHIDDRGYIEVDDELRTSVSGVWALGDCNGSGTFTHTSYNDFEIVAANLLDDDHRRVNDRILTYGLFIDPPLGRVGMTEAEVRASGRPALVGKRPMSRIARAIEKGETQGFMKILVDAEDKQILGAAVLGVGGDELVHLIVDTMYAKAPYTVIQRAVHIHPTVSELVPTMLGALKPLE